MSARWTPRPSRDEQIAQLERQLGEAQRRHQRVLEAYLALREVRDLPLELRHVLESLSGRARARVLTPLIARLIEAEQKLQIDDLRVQAS